VFFLPSFNFDILNTTSQEIDWQEVLQNFMSMLNRNSINQSMYLWPTETYAYVGVCM